MPKVSIVLNCYNGERYLAETLKTIKKQTFKDYELIFWDNGSTDNTSRIAHTFDKRLKYFYGEVTVPLGEARNEALKKATGEYIAFIDADDLWVETKLEKQVAIIEKCSECGLVCTNFESWNMINGRRKIFEKNAKFKKMEFSEFGKAYNYRLSSFLIRKKAIERLDHYFDDHFEYVEEYDLFLRIAYFWKCIYIPDVLVVYRIHNNMNTILISKEIPSEYENLIVNLRKFDQNIDKKYPDVIKWIEYSRDLFLIKENAIQGNNKKVKKLSKQYLNYNLRAVCFFTISCLPSRLSQIIYKKIIKN